MAWKDYKREGDSVGGGLLPGDYRVEITDVKETVTKELRLPMIVLSLRPNGAKFTVRHYIVQNDKYNKNINSFFDSFDVDDGDFQFNGWVGAVGAARLVKEEDSDYLRVQFLLNKRNADKLTPWKGPKPERKVSIGGQNFVKVDEEELNF